MRLYSENNFRESGKMLVDASKFALVTLCVTSQLPNEINLSSWQIGMLIFETLFFFFIGNVFIRIADRMANKKEYYSLKKRK